MKESSTYTSCVVIPVYLDFSSLSEMEKISLRQVRQVLKDHPFCLVGPASLNWALYMSFFEEGKVKPIVKTFSQRYFSGIGGYSRLLVSPLFYKAFTNYRYILIYQTDAFVFCDELDKWCSTGFDFIGAPWFDKFSSNDEAAHIVSVGNGGFSLRKVSAHLKVLHSFSYLSKPKKNWELRMQDSPKGFDWFKQAGGYLLDLVIRNNTFWLLNSFMGFEDQFWCLIVAKNFKWFTMPSVHEAMKFSIEMQPARVYASNNYTLPFGCHAWWKYGADFWKPHVEKFGHKLPANELNEIKYEKHAHR